LRTVVDAVLSLEEPYRETVLLRWFEGLQPRAIAERQRASVATVHSRLQRAHAILRERLRVKLGCDERDLRGALLGLFGARGTEAATISTASFSLLGIAMTTTKWISAAGIAALGLCAFLYCDGSRGVPPPLVAESRAGDAKLEGSAIESAEIGATREPRVAGTAAVANSSESTTLALEPGPYVFDLTVVPIDVLGRPLASVDVWFAPEGQPLVKLGSTVWNGRLHATWRGFDRASTS
jgi:hypothetical protein